MTSRRQFISLLGSATVASSTLSPTMALAQAGATRRIGVLMSAPEESAELQTRYATFRQKMAELGWIEGQNIRIDVRWDAGSPERANAAVSDLLSLDPELIVVGNPIPLDAVVRQSPTISILFLSITDPLETGYVQSLARPGGRITGFSNFETQTAAKWLELLKKIVPSMRRTLVMWRSQTRGMVIMQRLIEGAGPPLGLQIVLREVTDATAIVREIKSFAGEPNGGLIVLVGPIFAHRDLIVTQAARHGLPAIYPYRFYAEGGGLLSYGIDAIDIYRRGATYADRILKGEKPAELPVQAPTKYEMVINLKTAKALGLVIPPTLLALADEVIE